MIEKHELRASRLLAHIIFTITFSVITLYVLNKAGKSDIFGSVSKSLLS